MKIEITIDGVTRMYYGDYDTLHNLDWNGRIREHLDDVKEYNEKEL